MRAANAGPVTEDEVTEWLGTAGRSPSAAPAATGAEAPPAAGPARTGPRSAEPRSAEPRSAEPGPDHPDQSAGWAPGSLP